MPTEIDTAELQRRVAAAAVGARAAGVDALLVSPGPDLRYLTGYAAVALERLTCLVLPADREPFLIVPELEVAAAQASPAGGMGIELVQWSETEDPYRIVAQRLGQPTSVAVDNHMWAEKTLKFAAAMPDTAQRLAGDVIGPLRMRKSDEEVEALRRAGAAIDTVHEAMGEWLWAGRTERDVGQDIAAAIVDAGHAQVDFVIVASGPNGASPHHEVSDRAIQVGDPVVVDIGGTMPDGYCSDATRTYCVGDPPADFADYYRVLQEAQAAAVAAVQPGVACQAIDAAARDVIAAAGYGDRFIHRTGHGIGLETHEDPYLVAGNKLPLAPGHAFSVEPGIYLPGRHGARIEDIVVCGPDGPVLLNHRPRDLAVVQ